MNHELLKKLCETFGPTGQDRKLAEVITEELKGSDYAVEVDPLGNVVARKGQGPYPVFATHTDQRGWVVEYKDHSGVLHLKSLPVDNHLGDGWAIDSQGERYRVFSQEDQKVFKACPVSKETASDGKYIVPQGPFVQSEDSVFSHALSDRTGVALLLDLAGNSSLKSAVFVFHAKRHMNFMGLLSAVRNLDITKLYFVDSLPVSNHIVMGAGPVMVVRGQRSIPPEDWVDEIQGTCLERGIKFQKAVSLDFPGASDVVSREGIPSLTLALPIEFHGSNIEKLSCSDYEGLNDLLTALGKGGA